MVFLVYVTAGNLEEARRLARKVVEERLAACANVVGEISSFYWWEGKVEEDREVALLLKTREDLVEPLIERTKALHSYTCPCVVAWPLEKGFKPFLAWVREETQRV